MYRRSVLAAASAALAVGAVCGLRSGKRLAHTVSVYLADREATRDVRVRILDVDGETLFDRPLRLSDANEAVEDATFPASATPDRVVVVVDGERFERPWPGPETGRDCGEANRAGVEVYVEGSPDEAPGVRFDRNCQHVTVS